MKKLRTSFGAKLAAVIMAAVTMIIGTLLAFAISFFVANQFYYDGGRSALDKSLSQIGKDYSNNVIFNYYPAKYTKNVPSDSYSSVQKFEKAFSSEKTNFSFALYNESGVQLLSNYECRNSIFTSTYSDTLTQNDGSEIKLNVVYSINGDFTAADEFFFAYTMNRSLARWSYSAIILLSLSVIIFALLTAFLIYSVGCKRTENGEIFIQLSFFDRIPLDLLMLIFLLIMLLSARIIPNIGSAQTFMIKQYFLALIGLTLIYSAVMTLSVRCKKDNPLKNTVIYRLIKRIFAPEKRLVERVKGFLNALPAVWKSIILLCAVSLIEFVVIAVGTKWEIFFFWIIEKLITVPIILILSTNLSSLKRSVKKIADGDIEHKVDTENLLWGLKYYGEGLNNIGSTMQSVVDERMKTERAKTELITNVSHDIKTPLTSIITYVDLLKTQDVSPQSAADYIDVLDRQSKKLAKLVNDLVDASQASAGNITVNCEPNDAGVILTQAAAEYDERFRSANLTPVVQIPDFPVMILADGSLLWRVFDNLLSNICKYSLPGTRVYMSVKCNESCVKISFSNISKCPLKLSADELSERFVRGDSSRNTDGSGLGLSIAESLTSLQGGKLTIDVDGDLFKAIITFDAVQSDNL